MACLYSFAAGPLREVSSGYPEINKIDFLMSALRNRSRGPARCCIQFEPL